MLLYRDDSNDAIESEPRALIKAIMAYENNVAAMLTNGDSNQAVIHIENFRYNEVIGEIVKSRKCISMKT